MGGIDGLASLGMSSKNVHVCLAVHDFNPGIIRSEDVPPELGPVRSLFSPCCGSCLRPASDGFLAC